MPEWSDLMIHAETPIAQALRRRFERKGFSQVGTNGKCWWARENGITVANLPQP